MTQTWNGPLAMPSTNVNFEGIGQGLAGFTVQWAPPDTDGDVGPNHYVQIVNTDFAVFNKSGTLLYGPVSTNTLWSGFGGACQTANDGDAVVKYDKRADRWIFEQPVFESPYMQCLAISTTADPTGSYARYSYTFSNFPDYPKLSVWPDGYYMTYNMFNGNSFVGGETCAYDRSKMLTGAAATQQCFGPVSAMGGSVPSDLDGPTDPPAGSPDYVMSYETFQSSPPVLLLWKAHVDWVEFRKFGAFRASDDHARHIFSRLRRGNLHPPAGNDESARLARGPVHDAPWLPELWRPRIARRQSQRNAARLRSQRNPLVRDPLAG